jgi:hypothetical protein
VTDYGLDDRVIGVRSPVGVKDFSSNLCVQTGSGAHPASCTMGTGGPFPGAKRGRGVTLTTHPHLVPRSRMSRSYSSSPPPQVPSRRVAGLLCFFALLRVPVKTISVNLETTETTKNGSHTFIFCKEIAITKVTRPKHCPEFEVR